MKQTMNNKRQGTEGVALITAVIFLVVMGLFATFAMSRVSNHTRQVSAHEIGQDTYLGLLSAHDESQRDADVPIGIAADTDFNDVDPADMPNALRQAILDFDESNPNANPQLASNPNVRYAAITNTVDYGALLFQDIATYATAQYHNPDGSVAHQRTIMNINRASTAGNININVWTNAIFAGVQQTGNVINGNVSVHGSVHILGDDAVLGDASVVLPDVMELSGTAGIYNNYDGMPADLESRIIPLGVDADGNETLEAKFRVKNGMISINGNTSIGEGSANSGSKAYMDGVYVGDPDSDDDINWMGNKTTSGIPNDGVINSDNGWNTGYDLGDAISFPFFEEVVNETYEGQIYFDKNDSTSYYLTDQIPYSGDITIEAGDPGTNFYYNASTGDTAVGGTPGDGSMPTKAEVETLALDAANNPGDFIIWYDGATDTLFVNGRVAVDGDINFLSGNGQNDTIYYEGQGSMLAYDGSSGGGNVVIDASILTTGFPLTNVIGVMAEGNFLIGDNSQLAMMGGFYAQGGITLDKQTTVVGTIVGDYFDMGGQVPNIYQVPALQNAWVEDTRMIGSGHVNPPANNANGAIWYEVGVAL